MTKLPLSNKKQQKGVLISKIKHFDQQRPVKHPLWWIRNEIRNGFLSTRYLFKTVDFACFYTEQRYERSPVQALMIRKDYFHKDGISIHSFGYLVLI